MKVFFFLEEMMFQRLIQLERAELLWMLSEASRWD